MTGFPIIQKLIHWFEEKINGMAFIWLGLYVLVGNIRQILQSSGFCLGVHIDIQSFILTFKVSFREHWFTSKLSTTFWNLEECKKKFELPLNYLNNFLSSDYSDNSLSSEYGTFWTFWFHNIALGCWYVMRSLGEKCPKMELFLVRIFLCSDQK